MGTQQKMIFIKLFRISILFLILVYFTNCDKNDNCPDINKENSCKWAEPGKPSIVVRTTAGRIGNILFGYLILLGRKMEHGLHGFIPKLKWSIAATYFDNLEILAAEDNICDFERDYEIFFRSLNEAKFQRIIDHIRKKANDPDLELPRGETGKILVPKSYWDDPYYEIDRIVHQDSFAKLPENISMPEPWLIAQSGDVKELENRNILQGHVILDYADSVTNFEHTTSIPGIADRLESNLKFKQKYMNMSQKTVQSIISSHLKKIKSKKKRKKMEKDLTLVGIHVRRGDHISYEIEKGIPVLKASYFLEAMEKYRSHFGNKVIFILVSDDIEWCKEALSKRNRIEDLYFASDPSFTNEDGIGHDIAVMSQCKHSIVSRGTFSYWSGFLAGGSVILPCHFPNFRSQYDLEKVCKRDPLKNPLERLYQFIL